MSPDLGSMNVEVKSEGVDDEAHGELSGPDVGVNEWLHRLLIPDIEVCYKRWGPSLSE